MKAKRAVVIVGVSFLLAAMPALGHHSFKVQYDENQPITLNGTVTKVTWKNPHVLVSIDVKDGSGNATNWELELASPNGLLSQGWKVDSLKQGDQVTANGYPARDGSHLANIRKVSFAVH